MQALFMLAVMVLMVVSLWKVFQKAGQPGWAAIVPIYNLVVMVRISGNPGWWVLLCLIPLVNIYFGIKICIDFIKKFGQPTWHVIIWMFFGYIYIPYLAFSKIEYQD